MPAMRHRLRLLFAMLAVCALVPSRCAAAAADPSDTCTAGTLLAGYAGPVSVVLRLQPVDAGTVWVCIAADDGSRDHAGGLLQVGPPATVTFQPDPPGADQPPVPPPPPVPSGTCQAEPGATRVLDMQLPAGERAWVYLAPGSGGGTDVCTGVGGPLIAFGARTSPGGPPLVDSPGVNSAATG